MSRAHLEDPSLANPLGLLARYRELCEAFGAAAAVGAPLPKSIQEELSRIEGELQTRLWLASAERSSLPRVEPTRLQVATQSLSTNPQVDSTGRDQAASHLQPLTATVYCDGACIGNPGPGGYCAVVRIPGRADETISGGKTRTTNNEMELTAAIAGIRLALSRGAAEIAVVSDSEYLVKGMSSWLRGWLRNGWKTRSGAAVKNRRLWEELNSLCEGHAVSWSWTEGHAGHPENELCNDLAVFAAREAANSVRAGKPR